MTTASIQDRVDELFADARQVHAQAVERLEHGDIRDAAEKAWCAAKRATDGLILALTGEEPSTTAATTNYLDSLARRVPDTRRLQGPLLQPDPQPPRDVLLRRILQRPDRTPHQGDHGVH